MTVDQTDSGLNSDTYVVDVPIYAKEDEVVRNGSSLCEELAKSRLPTPLSKVSTSARFILTLKSILCTGYG